VGHELERTVKKEEKWGRVEEKHVTNPRIRGPMKIQRDEPVGGKEAVKKGNFGFILLRIKAKRVRQSRRMELWGESLLPGNSPLRCATARSTGDLNNYNDGRLATPGSTSK